MKLHIEILGIQEMPSTRLPPPDVPPPPCPGKTHMGVLLLVDDWTLVFLMSHWRQKDPAVVG